jgi:predicted Zn-dependent protease/TolA-binding protein
MKVPVPGAPASCRLRRLGAPASCRLRRPGAPASSPAPVSSPAPDRAAGAALAVTFVAFLLGCLWLVFLAPASAADKPAGAADKPEAFAPASGFPLLTPPVLDGDRARAVRLWNNGVELMRRNLNTDAAASLQQALALSPDFAEAHHDLGLVLAKLGDTNGAIDHLKEARRLKPDLDAAWLTLAGVYQSSGQIDTAIDTYTEFLKRFPMHEMQGRIKRLVEGLQAERRGLKQPDLDARRLSPAAGGSPERPNRGDYLPQMASRNGIGPLRWPSRRMPIKVFIHDGSSTPGYQTCFRDILTRCFNDWSSASEGRVKFVMVPMAEEAQLEVVWEADPRCIADQAEAGEAKVYTDQDGIADCQVKIMTRSLSRDLPLTPNRMRAICLHEIGHALGLAGHTDNPMDIMFYSASFQDNWRELGERDARTIRLLYAEK